MRSRARSRRDAPNSPPSRPTASSALPRRPPAGAATEARATEALSSRRPRQPLVRRELRLTTRPLPVCKTILAPKRRTKHANAHFDGPHWAALAEIKRKHNARRSVNQKLIEAQREECNRAALGWAMHAPLVGPKYGKHAPLGREFVLMGSGRECKVPQTADVVDPDSARRCGHWSGQWRWRLLIFHHRTFIWRHLPFGAARSARSPPAPKTLTCPAAN